MKLDHSNPQHRMRMFFGVGAACWGASMWLAIFQGGFYSAVFFLALATAALVAALRL